MGGDVGKWMILAGLALAIVGMIVYFFHDHLHWVGRLPGDIHINRGNVKVYIPITTMILASVVLTLILRIVSRFLR